MNIMEYPHGHDHGCHHQIMLDDNDRDRLYRKGSVYRYSTHCEDLMENHECNTVLPFILAFDFMFALNIFEFTSITLRDRI